MRWRKKELGKRRTTAGCSSAQGGKGEGWGWGRQTIKGLLSLGPALLQQPWMDHLSIPQTRPKVPRVVAWAKGRLGTHPPTWCPV